MKNLISWMVAAFVISLLGSCSTTGAKPEGDATEPKSIMFVDTEYFDSELSAIMAKQPSAVTLRFAGEVTTSTLPDRLGKWFYVLVHRYGGALDVQYDPAYPLKKDLSMVVAQIVYGLFAYLQEYMLYRPVKDYNAVVYVVPEKNTITYVQFVRK